MAGATPLMDPQSVFNLLAEPLRVTLSGKFFTAVVARLRTHSKTWLSSGGQENPRYIGTKFNLLGRAHLPVTVLAYLQHQLCARSPAPSLPYCPAGVKASESSSQRANTQFSSTEKSSVLSLVPSTAGEQSPIVSLHSFASCESFQLSEETLGSSTDDNNPNSLKNHLLSDFSDCTSAIGAPGCSGAMGGIGKREENSLGDRDHYLNSPLEDLSTCGDFLEGYATDSAEGIVRMEDYCLPHEAHSNNSEWCTEVSFGEPGKCVSREVGTGCCAEDKDDILMCDDVLSELMSTWREEDGHTVGQKRNSLQFYEDSESLPDSESFLKEFQCDFDQSPSFLTTSTNVAVPLLQSSSTPDSAEISPTFNKAHPAQHSSLGSCSKKLTCDNAPLSLQQTPLDTVAQYTPELFTSSLSTDSTSSTSCSADEYTSVRNLSSSSAGGATMSPELFSSPRPIMSLEADKRSTPVAGRDIKQPPKRRLLHPLHSFLQQAHTQTPPSSANDSLSHCFSPELFP